MATQSRAQAYEGTSDGRQSVNGKTRTIFIEAPGGDSFRAEIDCGTPLRKIASDFFYAQGWPEADEQGRGQKAVVELVDSNNTDKTKRLNSNADICDKMIENDMTLRIFPESVAGAVDPRIRRRALITDHNEMKTLCQGNRSVTFNARPSREPSLYQVTLRYKSFTGVPLYNNEPYIGEEHHVEILLTADYPRRAPIVTWLTPIFHPNIRGADGAVCLGALRERYRPNLGVAGLVKMLIDMLRYRNFDVHNAFDRDAAKWAANSDNWDHIKAIGGYPFQGTVADIVKQLDQATLPKITFHPCVR